MIKALSHRQIIIHIGLYAIVFGVLAKTLSWPFFLPVALAIVIGHLWIMERRKRVRYRGIVKNRKTTQIEGYPILDSAENRSVDEVLIESLEEVSTELEKKCYQLVEKNIQLLSLKEISLSIISSLDESRIVDSVQSFLTKGLGFNEILVGIYDPEREVLHLYTFREAHGESSHHEDIKRLDELEGLLRKAVITRKSLLIRDPEMHPIGKMNGRPIFDGSTMKSYLVVPMVKSKLSQTCWKAQECILKNPSNRPQEEASVQQAICPACEQLPVLGLIGITDGYKAASLSQVDLVAVETLALQISTLLENSQLYHELKKEELFRENIINSMMNGLITVDTEGAILLANESAEEMTGYGADELKGMDIEQLIFDKETTNGGPFLKTLHERRKRFQKEAWLIRKDQKKLPIILNTTFLLDEDKQIQGALGVFIDTTRIKRMEEKIAQLDKLAALGRFSSSMAHEIRNPLTGIVAGLQYLKRVGGIPEDQDENITFILSEVNRIDRLISDILNVVRGGELVYHPVQIESLIQSCATTVGELARKHSVTFRTHFPERTRSVMVDSDRITQVLINLLKNAVEASHKGGEIRIKVAFQLDDHDVLFDEIGNLVIIEIEDDGIGFNEEEKGKIFEPFFSTKPEGVGLGLYVTHSIVERHGGYIFVESEKNKGTVFTVYLPVEKVEHGDTNQLSHPIGG